MRRFSRILKSSHTYTNKKRLFNYRWHISHPITYHQWQNVIAVVPEDKDSCVIIMKRVDYITKMQAMIDDGITCGVYTPTADNTLKDLWLVTSDTTTLRIIQNMRKCYQHQTSLHDYMVQQKRIYLHPQI